MSGKTVAAGAGVCETVACWVGVATTAGRGAVAFTEAVLGFASTFEVEEATVVDEELEAADVFAAGELLEAGAAALLGEIGVLLEVELTVVAEVAALLEPLPQALKPREAKATSVPTLSDRVAFMVRPFLSTQ